MLLRRPLQVLASSILLGFALHASTHADAATMKVSPQGAQPGDVVSISIFPAPGETIAGIGMRAWDTAEVKFSLRADGVARAFVGFPFDRKGGAHKLQARVSLTKDGAPSEQVLTAVLQGRDRHYPTQRFSMRGGMASTMSRTSQLRAEKLYVQSKMKSSSPSPLWSGSWLIPTQGTASSAYGRRRYINGKWWGQHNGADIKAPTGRAVIATNSGRVVLSELLPTLRGNCVVIDHGCNIFSLYLHLSRRDVAVGQTVTRGQRIGAVGATGFVTGAHLHWEMRVGWEPMDPFKFVARGVQF
jgi:murein DD-endopeptidase MepM/ murein hydrolase activator NlpD